MEIQETVRLATSAIRRNKSRSFLTMLGIIIGVFAVISLVSLGTGLKNYITDQFEVMGSNVLYVMPGSLGGDDENMSFSAPPNFSGSKLENSYVRDIKSLGDPIIDAIGHIEIPTSVRSGNNQLRITAIGTSPEISNFISITVKEGRFFNSSEVAANRKVAVIGPEVAEKLYGNQEALGKEIIISDARFKVVGILDNLGAGMIGGGMDKSAYIPITTAQNIFGMENLQSIMIKFADSDSLDETKYKVKNLLLKTLKEDDFSLINQGALLSTITSIMGVLTAALGGIAAISLLVGGIGIMNIMLVSVTERTREIGIRKAVGAKNSDILTQFLAEAVFLSLVGGLIGTFLGVLATMVVGKLISANAFSWWSIALALGVSSLVGIIFGVAPAAKASKLDPVEALRYE
jgi:ABC-type antimicrobial peptide transport system permease subunit